MIQTVPSVPSTAEAAVAIGSAAPTAIPVIAKAAVGIGLAAAVLTPSGDSAVHQAFDAYSAEDSAELLEGRSGTSLGTEEPGNLPVVVEVSPAARTEPVEIADDATTDSFVPVQSSTATAAPASITVSSSGLEVVSAGPGRYSITGLLSISSESSAGLLETVSIDGLSSRLRIGVF